MNIDLDETKQELDKLQDLFGKVTVNIVNCTLCYYLPDDLVIIRSFHNERTHYTLHSSIRRFEPTDTLSECIETAYQYYIDQAGILLDIPIVKTYYLR